MTKLQDDLLSIYNSLVEFSKITLGGALVVPIKVDYSENLGSLFFEQSGKKVGLSLPNWYSGGLKEIHHSYLMPSDYDYLMGTLSNIIESGVLLGDHVCISPEMYGFDIWNADSRDIKNGPKLLGQVRFVTSNSWLFKLKTKLKYRAVL